MQKRILVTGGAGFIGSNLIKKLLSDKNNFVICLDNLFTGRKQNIEDFLHEPNFEFIEHDIIEKIDIKADEIYNLACPASPIHYQYNPIQTIKTAFLGTLNMLELAKKNNAKFLLTSTSEIYGNPLVHPQKEDYFGNVNPIGTRSCYDEGKRAAETLVSDYNRQYGINSRIVRIFNTYGVNMAKNDGRVVSNFIVQALLNKDITIYGKGSQTRSFCYVSDMVSGLISMMNNTSNFLGPVNIGNPDERTILDLAKKIIYLTNSSSKIIFKELPDDDPIRRNPDITLAKDKLKWEPKVSIDEGLKNTIEYFRQIISEENKC